MSVVEDAATAFMSMLRQSEGAKHGDTRYIGIREQAKSVLLDYVKNPLEMELVEQCDRIVDRLQELGAKELSDLNYQRSQANVAFVSAQSKRTHYAAYVAGRWSTDERLGGAFKAWMHNSAADGALALYEAIHRATKAESEAPVRMQMLDVFGQGSLHDAQRFLFLADDFYPTCAVTQYNQGKINILSGKQPLITRGIAQLKTIPPPSSECHPAELSWHTDNDTSFANDLMVRDILLAEHPDEIDRITQVLQNNGAIAQAMREERGERIWKNQTDYTKALVVAAVTGILITLWVVLGGGGLSELHDLLSQHVRLTNAALKGALAGGGGLIHLAQVSALFGGGGLA